MHAKGNIFMPFTQTTVMTKKIPNFLSFFAPKAFFRILLDMSL